jgi:hypothetical protein
MWKAKTVSNLTNDNVRYLFDNSIGAIRIEGFLSRDEVERLIRSLDQFGFSQYAYSFEEKDAPPAKHIFDTHYLYEHKSVEEYAQSVVESEATYKMLCSQAGFSPVAKLLQSVQENWDAPVRIASEEKTKYFPCIARELNHSVLLHADFAPFISGSWSIQNIVSEFAWNIYLTEPESGGECVVYNRPWELEDNKQIVKDTYGYAACVVEGAEKLIVKPKAGELVIFNSRNFHEVKSASSRRLSLGGHLGLKSNDEIISWS